MPKDHVPILRQVQRQGSLQIQETDNREPPKRMDQTLNRMPKMTPEERKAHRAEYMRKYRETHREQLRANNRKYSQSEKGKEHDKKRREKHREKHRILTRKYYQENREELLLKAKNSPKRKLSRAKQSITDMDKRLKEWLKEYNALFN